jgi:hypothetical protein
MPGTERWIVICGSMSQHDRMREQKDSLEETGIEAVLPPPDEHGFGSLAREEYEAVKRRVALAHFSKIMDRRTFAVLIVNADKHGVRNYIGPNTFAEAAVAFSQGKRIYLLQDVPETLADELRAWGAVPLYGKLDRLMNDYYASCRAEGTPASASG